MSRLRSESFLYKYRCKYCRHILLIEQHGNDLCEEILDHVVVDAHVKNIWDARWYYFGGVKIDIEILNNKKCAKTPVNDWQIV